MAQAPDAATLPPPERPKKKRGWVKALIIIGSVLAVLAVLVIGTGAFIYTRFGQIKIIDVDTAEAPAEYEPVNILLMGSDSRSGKGNNKYGLDAGRGGQRSDTTILLHISGDRSRALAVSIPRDLWAEQPDCANPDRVPGYYDKFNNAFDAGGPACTTELVKDLTGVPIHHIAVIDFAGFKEVVDALGGVEVCLNRPVDDDASRLNLPAGNSVISGEQALAFVRARKTLGDGSDIGRIERQQQFLSSAIRKVTDTQMLLNPARVFQVLDTATRALTVDKSLDDINEMRRFLDSVRSIRPSDITFTTMPFIYRDDLANVDVDQDKAEVIWDAIRDDTPWPPAPSVGSDGEKLTVAPEDIWVNVVDSSGGKAKLNQVAAELRDAGFNVGETSRSGRKSDTTRVTYPRGQEDDARTVGYAADAVMVKDSNVWSVTLEVGSDFKGVNSAIVIAKPPKSVDDGQNTTVTTADKRICAG